ncbi:hypothetical protein ACHAXT_000987 [Thalassiosira profunda]
MMSARSMSEILHAPIKSALFREVLESPSGSGLVSPISSIRTSAMMTVSSRTMQGLPKYSCSLSSTVYAPTLPSMTWDFHVLPASLNVSALAAWYVAASQSSAGSSVAVFQSFHPSPLPSFFSNIFHR